MEFCKSSYCFIHRDGFTVFLGALILGLLDVLQKEAISPNKKDLPQTLKITDEGTVLVEVCNEVNRSISNVGPATQKQGSSLWKTVTDVHCGLLLKCARADLYNRKRRGL